MALLVYIDDIILAGNGSHACIVFKNYLALASASRILCLSSISFALKGLFLSRHKYALEIMDECGLLSSKPSAFPMEANHKLVLATGSPLIDAGRYRRLVGRLIYLTITRPNLCYAVHILSQFMQNPREKHMAAACWVLRYIKGTPDCGILLQANSKLQLSTYCDSDWGACPLTRHSLTGYLVTVEGSPVSWKIKNQTTVSRSSAKVKYRSMAAATRELIWLKPFLASLGVFHNQTMQLFCDSQVALYIARNPVFHECTKHIEIDCHFVCEQYHVGELTISYVPSKLQPADIFTKVHGNR